MMNMDQLYKLALDPRKYPDSRLLAVLQGRDTSLPMAVAMAAKLERDKLGVATKGAQAQISAKQPTVKDKMLAQSLPPIDIGLAGLPADNMMGMDERSMAAGGIVAFADTDPDDDKTSMPIKTEQEYQDLLRGVRRKTPEQTAAELERQRQFFMSPRTRAALASTAQTTAPVISPQTDEQKAEFLREQSRGIRAPLATSPAAPPPPPPAAAAAAPAATEKPASWLDQFKSYSELAKKDQEDYLSKLAGAGEKAKEGIARLRREAGGEALMNFAAGLLSKPTLAQGVAAGLPGVIAWSAGARKEQRELERAASDMELNLAKARTAAAQGDRESALKFAELASNDKYRADMIKYHMASLNKDINFLKAVEADPKLSALYKGAKGKDIISRTDAVKEYNDILEKNPKRARELRDLGITNENAYYNYLLTGNAGILSATIPGQGANVIGRVQ